MSREPSPVAVAITGMHRSGTSMITRALHDSGLTLVGSGADRLIDAADDNPEGFWENKAIVACNDELLEATGGSWDNPPDLPPLAVDDPRVARIADVATATIAALSEHDHWGFKDPRTCLTAGYWLDLVPDLRFVICVRHPIEVALSLKRRNQNSYSLGLALWERYYTTVLAQVPAERRIMTHYDTFFSDPENEIRRICDFVGLTPTAPRVLDELRHHEIDIPLADAGASPTLRALYAALCRQAGVTVPPEMPPSEGRVRRLILDGAVAQRHADQRQAEIDRLRAREAELSEHVHELELRLQRERVQSLQALEKAVREIGPGPIRLRTRRLSRRAYKAGRRIVVARTPRALPAPSAPRLPEPARELVQRAGRVAERGRQAPLPTAKHVTRKIVDRSVGRGVGRRVASKARAAAKRLPPSATKPVGRAQRLVRRALEDPAPTAKRMVDKLPGPAQGAARGAARRIRSARRSAATARRKKARGRQGEPTPKGPPPRTWKRGYRRIVATAIPKGASALVAVPGSPRSVRDAVPGRGTAFPTGGAAVDDLSLVAQLEALRYGGARFFVVPEGSRPWFRRRVDFNTHVMRSYRRVVDEARAGVVFDLEAPQVEAAPGLRAEIERLAAGLDGPPAVLVHTELDVAGELRRLATFRPPVGAGLPYLDASVDIVVVDEGGDLDAARRVASVGVVVIAPGPSGVDVRGVEARRDAAPGPDPLRILVMARPIVDDDDWEPRLGARVEQAGAQLRIAPIDAAGLAAAAAEHDVVVMLEPHVLPLPGAIEAAARHAAASPTTAIAGKVVAADGGLESAGGAVFSDRSVALIGYECAEARASWHEYVRPVCWAPGIVAASASLCRRVGGPRGVADRAFLREWCAAVWASGSSVVYQPAAAAVRVRGSGAEPSTPLESSAWQRVLDLRPKRPTDLTDASWRSLLSHDDVEASRG